MPLLAHDGELAPDGKPYWLAQRFGSFFTWGRPPLPPNVADALAAVVNNRSIRSALVLGSCCPSVLTALAFGDYEREIRMIDMESRWWEGYSCFLEDCTDPEEYPRYDAWLPSKKILACMEWSWSPRLGEMIFVDLPGNSPLIGKDLRRVVSLVEPRLVAMGFMQNHAAPHELEEALIADGWNSESITGRLRNHETSESLDYRLVVAVPKPTISHDQG